MKPSSFKSKSYILGIGNGFLLILLFNFLKSEMKQAIPLFMGIINVGAGHSDLFLCFKISMFTNLFTSVFSVSSCTFGIGNSFALYS